MERSLWRRSQGGDLVAVVASVGVVGVVVVVVRVGDSRGGILGSFAGAPIFHSRLAGPNGMFPY